MDVLRTLNFYVTGRPAPQGSKNIGAHGSMREASRFLAVWRKQILIRAMEARLAAPDQWPTFDGAVSVQTTFYTARPIGTQFKMPIGPPDVDKLARAVLDALTQAGVYADDSRVIDLHVRKRWALQSHVPGARVAVECLRAPEDPVRIQS